MACLRGKERLDNRFLRYLIGSRSFTDHVLGVQTGTAVPHISGKQIGEFEFHLPPLPEQRAIAHVLGTLDDKIELKRRMNATLEALARAIFKSWFVDFDPVHAKARGEQPAGMDAATAALFPAASRTPSWGRSPRGGMSEQWAGSSRSLWGSHRRALPIMRMVWESGSTKVGATLDSAIQRQGSIAPFQGDLRRRETRW